MSRLLCCLRARRPDMGAALSHHQEGDVCEGAGGGVPASPPTMADVIRERKKKGGGGVGTLRRRLGMARRGAGGAARGGETARLLRALVAPWPLADVFLLLDELEGLAALRDLATQAELAREPAPGLAAALRRLRAAHDVTLVGAAWALPAHRALLAARSPYLRALLLRQHDQLGGAAGGRLVLEGAAAALPKEAATAALAAFYGAPDHCVCREHDNGNPENDLDIISDNTNSWCQCCSRRGWRRGGAALGLSRDPLHVATRYLLDSGELCDMRLVFRSENGTGAQYGFRSALELPCHRFILAARSRVFRSVLCRRGAGGAGGAVGAGGASSVCIDEAVLPRRFARALLHAAYTDQVDLSLIGRNSSSPSSTNSSSGSGWVNVGRNTSRQPTTAMLDDAFQFYEIGRFLEMGIVVQGCEDAIVEALAPDTLPHVLRWAAAPHASQWVHRQACRYLRDEFVTIMSHSASAKLPSSALAEALASPFLQASEPTILRLIVKWSMESGGGGGGSGSGSGGGSGSGNGNGRRRVPDADLLAPLLPLVRVEHLPPNHDALAQLVRRGVVGAGAGAGAGSAAAWLGRGGWRPPRAFAPYLDELRALLHDQPPPDEAQLRARRQLHQQRMPDTLYMVAEGARGAGAAAAGGAEAGAGWALGARARAQLRARVRELRGSPAAITAARHPHHRHQVALQICLRAVRERSLPDACAELLMAEPEPNEGNEAEEGSVSLDRDHEHWEDDCCEHRAGNGSGSLRCASTGSLRSVPTLHIPLDNSRPGTCRREQTNRGDNSHHRSWSGECGRLSAAVPDVAMAPNANTHLLTPRDYFRHPPPWEYGGVVLQLDLGDGATHTPRPGSRAQRNSAAAPRHRDYAQAMSCLRTRSDEEELRAAIELSVIRAYSLGVGNQRANTLPHHTDRPRHGASALAARLAEPPSHAGVGGVGAVVGGAAGGGGRSPCGSPQLRHRQYAHLHDYRVEGGYGGSASTSRGHSPNNYA